MSKRRILWRVGFLTATFVVVWLELLAAFDGNPDTEPWTELIVAYVPDEVTMLAIGGLSLWLLVHFGKRYWKRRTRSAD